MTATIIDGKAHAAALRTRIAAEVAAFVAATGRQPGLAVVLVGEDAASAVYVRNKGKATVAAGMASIEHRRINLDLAAETVRYYSTSEAETVKIGVRPSSKWWRSTSKLGWAICWAKNATRKS